MKLTVRQKIFVLRLLEYFRKTEKPVHYDALAKELGLSKSTTYDMLKVLESMGLVRPIYVVPTEPGKHGRSKVMFLVTDKVIDLVYRPLGGADAKGDQLRGFLVRAMEKATKTYDGFWEGWPDDMKTLLAIAAKEESALAPRTQTQPEEEEWKELKEHILDTIGRQGKSSTYRLLYQLMALTTATSSPLARSTEVILAIVLSLRAAKYELKNLDPLRMLLEAPVSRERMLVLIGFAWGLVASNAKGRKFASDIGKNVEAYEESINKLSPEELAELHKFTREVWQSLDKHTSAAK